MFDKTFFKFALGFAAIVAVSITTLYIAQNIRNSGTDQTASVR